MKNKRKESGGSSTLILALPRILDVLRRAGYFGHNEHCGLHYGLPCNCPAAEAKALLAELEALRAALAREDGALPFEED